MTLSNAKMKQLGASSRKAKRVPARVQKRRKELMDLIDNYWRFFRDPVGYGETIMRRSKDTGKMEEEWVVGRWPRKHHIIIQKESETIISLKLGRRFLKLLLNGDEEIVLDNVDEKKLEEILAELKYRIKIGKFDDQL